MQSDGFIFIFVFVVYSAVFMECWTTFPMIVYFNIYLSDVFIVIRNIIW